MDRSGFGRGSGYGPVSDLSAIRQLHSDRLAENCTPFRDMPYAFSYSVSWYIQNTKPLPLCQVSPVQYPLIFDIHSQNQCESVCTADEYRTENLLSGYLSDIIVKTTSLGINVKSVNTVSGNDYNLYDLNILVTDKDTLDKYITILNQLADVKSVERGNS